MTMERRLISDAWHRGYGAACAMAMKGWSILTYVVFAGAAPAPETVPRTKSDAPYEKIDELSAWDSLAIGRPCLPLFS
jgi:hypothetical protein